VCVRVCACVFCKAVSSFYYIQNNCLSSWMDGESVSCVCVCVCVCVCSVSIIIFLLHSKQCAHAISDDDGESVKKNYCQYMILLFFQIRCLFVIFKKILR
jgi:hypothetical protein